MNSGLPFLAAFLGFGSGLLLMILKDRYDLSGKDEELNSSLGFFIEALCVAIKSRTSVRDSVVSFDDVMKRAFASRFGRRFNWRDFLIIHDVYVVWLAGGYISHMDVDGECERLLSAMNRIAISLRRG